MGEKQVWIEWSEGVRSCVRIVKLDMALKQPGRNAVVDYFSLWAQLLHQEIEAVSNTYLPHNKVMVRTERVIRLKYFARARGSCLNVIVMNIFDEFLFSENIHTQKKYYSL